jgi:hypothetical protein
VELDSVARHEAAALELIHIFSLLQTFLQVDDECRFLRRQLANVPKQAKRGYRVSLVLQMAVEPFLPLAPTKNQ